MLWWWVMFLGTLGLTIWLCFFLIKKGGGGARKVGQEEMRGDEDTMAKKPSWLAVVGAVFLFLALIGLIVALRWEKGSKPPLRTGSAREEVRKVKREVLFEGVRKQGDLSLEIAGTDIAISMPVDFWKDLIERFEKPTETDQDFERWDLTRKDEVIQILKQGIADQEKEEEEEIP